MTSPKEDQQPMTTREEALAKAAQDFIDKVDRGEARSVKSYAAFKAALALTASPGEQKPPPAAGWNEAIEAAARIVRDFTGAGNNTLYERTIAIVQAIEALRRAAPAPEGVSNPSAAAESNASAEAVELAYGLLWGVGCDRSTRGGNALYLARKALLEQLDRAGQGRGISAARKVFKDEEAGFGDIRYGVLARFSADLDGGVSIGSGNTGACDPASGGVASLHNDGHPEGAARPDGLSVEARLREALEHYAKEYCEGWCEQDAGCANFDHDCGGCLARRASAVGDEAKKSEGRTDEAKARADAVASGSASHENHGSQIQTGVGSERSSPSDPTAERREIVARALMEKWPGDYAWGDETREPNELAFETADAILAALDGGR